MKAYGIPVKIVNLTRVFYEDYSNKILHGGKLSESFRNTTGVREGCILSPTLFLLDNDWLMKKTTERRNGIQWTLSTRLEDLEFADDICLMSENIARMQRKTEKLREEGAKCGLKINTAKTNVLKINCADPSVALAGEPIEEVNSFKYLGSYISDDGGTEIDVASRINQASNAFRMLSNMWRSNELSRKTKLRLFNSNVKSVLLYGSETWKTTKALTKKLQVFINKCLRKILRVYWPEVISNEDLWRETGQEPVEDTIKRRKWRWIGHTLRKPTNDITRQALDWNPCGRRRRGRPRETWKRTLDKDLRTVNRSWMEVKGFAANRQRWKSLVEALCSPRRNRN
jgi:hypothetical protein